MMDSMSEAPFKPSRWPRCWFIGLTLAFIVVLAYLSSVFVVFYLALVHNRSSCNDLTLAGGPAFQAALFPSNWFGEVNSILAKGCAQPAPNTLRFPVSPSTPVIPSVT